LQNKHKNGRYIFVTVATINLTDAVEDVRLLASVTRIAARLRFPSTSTACNRFKSRQIHIR